jgi:hypothetical protein
LWCHQLWCQQPPAELLRMKDILLGSAKIAVDETRTPVLHAARVAG